MLLFQRSSRLLALSRGRPAASSAAFSSRVVAVASPTRKVDECGKDERKNRRSSSSSSVLAASSSSSNGNKQPSSSKLVAASALGNRSSSENTPSSSSASDRRTSEALVAALQQQQQPDSSSKALAASSTGAEESKSVLQAFAARLWASYDAALTNHPVAVKSATSFVGFLLGDLIAQSIVGLPYDARRTLRLVAFGVFMDGPIGHLWYTTLDRNVFPKDPTSTKAVVSKTALDQLLWAPAFSCVFFAFVNLFEGRPDLIIPAIEAKLLPMMAANYALWPLAHLINFRFVPSKQRILYINCVQIIWSAYLSHLSAGAIRAAGHF